MPKTEELVEGASQTYPFIFADLLSFTLSSAVTTTPAPLTTETWNVNSTTGIPAVGGGTILMATVGPPSDPSPEIVAISGYTATTLTVTRGVESSTVKTHAAGDLINCTLTAGALNSFLQAVNNLSDVDNATTAVANLGGGSYYLQTNSSFNVPSATETTISGWALAGSGGNLESSEGGGVFTFAEPGIIVSMATGLFASHSASYDYNLQIVLGSQTFTSHLPAATASSGQLSVASLNYCNTGDTIRVQAYQNSGATQALTSLQWMIARIL